MIAEIKAICAGALFAAGVVLDEKAVIPIGSAVAICSIMIWIGRKIQSIDDKFETGSKRMDRIEAAVSELQKTVSQRK